MASCLCSYRVRFVRKFGSSLSSLSSFRVHTTDASQLPKPTAPAPLDAAEPKHTETAAASLQPQLPQHSPTSVLDDLKQLPPMPPLPDEEEPFPISQRPSANIDHPDFLPHSYRRPASSPTLPLEAVAVPVSLQHRISSHISKSKLRASELRKHSSRLSEYRARETYKERLRPRRGSPIVLEPPSYTPEEVTAFTATRFPGTFAANVYVLAEIRRVLPRFAPRSLLDFGSGFGTSLLATTRVFLSSSFAARTASRKASTSEDGHDNTPPALPLRRALLVDNAVAMREVTADMLAAIPSLQDVDVQRSGSLFGNATSKLLFDMVIASYSLTELVRNTMCVPVDDPTLPERNAGERGRAKREKAAEGSLRKTVRALWRRVAPGGVFVVIDDGTAAGFEAVLFARELVRSMQHGDGEDAGADGDESDIVSDSDTERTDSMTGSASGSAEGYRIIAPCLHSGRCPLDGSLTRHQICRFVQRLNRPEFQRRTRPHPRGYEDEYLSYIVIQKLPLVGSSHDDEAGRLHSEWGRLIRAPLVKGRHVTIDTCTKDATLQRRVLSKKKSEKVLYSMARRSKWGDVWPIAPSGKFSQVMF